MSESVKRYDTSKVSRKERTPQGFLRIDARPTRVGVLSYTRQDGTVQRELRSPEEVFHPDSLATLAGAPVTDLHPGEMVSPDNAQGLSIGYSSDNPTRDGLFVANRVTLTHGPAIKAVEKGDRAELSCGYHCTLDMTPGAYQGEKYDAVQRDIRYNHIALGPKGWGRAGSDVALRLDSGDGISLETTEPLAPEEKPRMDEIEIKLDGATVKVSKDVAAFLARKDEKIATLEKALGAAEATAVTLRTDLAAAQDPKAVQAKVDGRISLEQAAKKILGDKEVLAGLTDRQIREKAVAKAQPETKLDGRSDDYVVGVFEALSAKPAQGQEGNASLAAANAAAHSRKDAAVTARAEKIKSNQEAWKAPLGEKK